MIKDIKKAKTAELEAELDLYRGALGEPEVASAETLTNNDKRVAEVARLVAAHGYPVAVTEEFLVEHPTIALKLAAEGEEVAHGEVIFFTAEELAEAEPNKPEEPSAPEAPETIPPAPQQEPKTAPGASEQTYLGKTITSVKNVLLNGKIYKDVAVASGETFRLTPDEFTSAVKTR